MERLTGLEVNLLQAQDFSVAGCLLDLHALTYRKLQQLTSRGFTMGFMPRVLHPKNQNGIPCGYLT